MSQETYGIQSTVFGVRVLGMSTLDHWGDQERVGV